MYTGVHVYTIQLWMAAILTSYIGSTLAYLVGQFVVAGFPVNIVFHVQ